MSAVPAPLGPRRRSPLAGRFLAGTALTVVAAVVLVFLATSAHYFTDVTPASFRHLWPKQPWIQIHLLGGLLAVLAGPFQLWSGLRRRSLSVHRWTGRLYLAGIGAGGVASLYLAGTAPGGPDRRMALLMMAAAWWTTTGMAYFAIVKRAIDQHKEWMIRSYVVTLGGFALSRTLEAIAVLTREGVPLDTPLDYDLDAAFLWVSYFVPLLVTETVLAGRRIAGRRRVAA